MRFLDAHRPANLEQLRARIGRFREHYNNRRPHQSLDQATPGTAWELLAHSPATEPIPLAVIQGKAAKYRQARRLDAKQLAQAKLTISKTGRLLPDAGAGEFAGQETTDKSVVEVTAANRQVYYQGYRVRLPTTFGGREFHRTISDSEYLLADPNTGEVVFSFPLPMIALQVKDRSVASYSIKGVHMAYPTKQWERKHEEFQEQYARRNVELPAVFSIH